jgi:hypothetical protein
MDILPEAALESPPPPNETGGNSKGLVTLNSAFENADSPRRYDMMGKPVLLRLPHWLEIWKNNRMEGAWLWSLDSVMKSNTLHASNNLCGTVYRIIDGFL